jgi:hypothetical protein
VQDAEAYGCKGGPVDPMQDKLFHRLGFRFLGSVDRSGLPAAPLAVRPGLDPSENTDAIEPQSQGLSG